MQRFPEFNSFLLLQGLETLSLRVERHVENALKVVEFLKNHPQVERVNHPSLATGHAKELYDRYFPKGAAPILFEIKGGAAEAKKIHREPDAVFSARQCGGCKIAGNSPASRRIRSFRRRTSLQAELNRTQSVSPSGQNISTISWDLEQGFTAVRGE